MGYIGATSSVGGRNMYVIKMGDSPKYRNEDFNEYIQDPTHEEQEASMMGSKCMPVGIYQTYMPVDKNDPDNLNMAQYNIRERFGYAQDEDYENGVEDNG